MDQNLIRLSSFAAHIFAITARWWADSVYWARSQNCVKRLLASSCLPVRPSVRTEQLGFHLTDLHENWYLMIFRKSVEKIKFSLKYDKENGYRCTFLIISRSFLLRMRKVSDKSCRVNQNTFCSWVKRKPTWCHLFYYFIQCSFNA